MVFLEMKKALRFLDRAYICGMEFTDYLIWKAVIVVAVAAVYQFWRGLNGK